MKKLIFAILATNALLAVSQAAVITMSGTTVGHRVVTFAAVAPPVVDFTPPQLVAQGGYLLGTMSDITNASTFKVFGSALLGSTTGFPSGGTAFNSLTNNTYATEFATLRYFLLFYSGNVAPTFDPVSHLLTGISAPFAGIYRSTDSFSATITNQASNTHTPAIINFSTAINPTSNWDYGSAAVTSGVNSYTGVAGAVPSARTGTVFDLGAAIPEPSTAALGLLAGLGLVARRRRA